MATPLIGMDSWIDRLDLPRISLKINKLTLSLYYSVFLVIIYLFFGIYRVIYYKIYPELLRVKILNRLRAYLVAYIHADRQTHQLLYFLVIVFIVSVIVFMVYGVN